MELIKADGPRYTREQIRKAFPLAPVQGPEQRATKAAPPPKGLAPPQRAGILKRAGVYLDKLDPGISGQGGHAATFNAALKIISGFDLTEDEALFLMLDRFNPRCEPLWTEDELRHKVKDAAPMRRTGGTCWRTPTIGGKGTQRSRPPRRLARMSRDRN